MSFKVKERGENRYVYFQISGKGDIFLSREGEKSSNPDKIFEALDYVKQRYGHFTDIENQLINFLPQLQKDEYISKRLNELDQKNAEYVKQLSDPAKQQYLSKGKQTAEDQTRLRPLDVISVSDLNFISELSQRLGLSIESERLAVDLLKTVGPKMSDVPMRILAATCVYLTIKLHGINLSEKEVEKESGVSAYNINLVINQMRDLFHIVLKLGTEKQQRKPRIKTVEFTSRSRSLKLRKMFLIDPKCYIIFCTLWHRYIHEKTVRLPGHMIDMRELLEISMLQEEEIKKAVSIMIFFELLQLQKDRRIPTYSYTVKSRDIFDRITNRFLESIVAGTRIEKLAEIQVLNFSTRLMSDEKLKKKYGMKLKKLLLPEETDVIFTPQKEYLGDIYQDFKKTGRTPKSLSPKTVKSD